MNSQINIANIVDYNTWHPLYEQLYPADPLEFIDEKKYSQQIVETQQLTQLNDSIQTGLATICGIPIAIGCEHVSFIILGNSNNKLLCNPLGSNWREGKHRTLFTLS